MGFNKEAASSSSHVLKVPSFPTEDTPLLRSQPLLSSKAKTFANVFIAIVGAGVLGLAYTFKKTGWITGCLMVFVIAFLSYRCMMLLIHTRRRLESLQGFKRIASFGDLGFTVCGPSGRLAVDVMIILAQAGFCASYLIFISNTLAYIFKTFAKGLRTFRSIEAGDLYINGVHEEVGGQQSIWIFRCCTK